LRAFGCARLSNSQPNKTGPESSVKVKNIRG
jgi:hypothetical protein